MATILRSQDSLQLNSVQADSIASLNRRYTYRADSLWAPVARELSTLAQDYNEGAAYARYMRARRAQLEMLIAIAPVVHDLLTPAQRRKLPPRVVNYMDPRYLVSIRDGSGTYVTSGEGGGFGGGGGGFRTEISVGGGGRRGG
jgi:uncharacterized membrane protein YgcG